MEWLSSSFLFLVDEVVPKSMGLRVHMESWETHFSCSSEWLSYGAVLCLELLSFYPSLGSVFSNKPFILYVKAVQFRADSGEIWFFLSSLASFASLSASSLPEMLQWLLTNAQTCVLLASSLLRTSAHLLSACVWGHLFIFRMSGWESVRTISLMRRVCRFKSVSARIRSPISAWNEEVPVGEEPEESILVGLRTFPSVCRGYGTSSDPATLFFMLPSGEIIASAFRPPSEIYYVVFSIKDRARWNVLNSRYLLRASYFIWAVSSVNAFSSTDSELSSLLIRTAWNPLSSNVLS